MSPEETLCKPDESPDSLEARRADRVDAPARMRWATAEDKARTRYAPTRTRGRAVVYTLTRGTCTPFWAARSPRRAPSCSLPLPTTASLALPILHVRVSSTLHRTPGYLLAIRLAPSCWVWDSLALMSTEQVDYSMSQLSLGSNASDVEDWDRSMSSDVDPNHSNTPRNSVSFPGHGAADNEGTPGRNMSLGRGDGKRTLSELLKLHAEKGTDVNFTQEEASRVADVLGQWVGVRPFTLFLGAPL